MPPKVERPQTRTPNPNKILSPSISNPNIGPRVVAGLHVSGNAAERARTELLRHQKVSEIFIPNGQIENGGENTDLVREVTYPDWKPQSGGGVGGFFKRLLGRS